VNKLKLISIFTLSFILGIALTVFLISPLITKAIRIAAEGDQNLQLGKPTTALQKYEEAQKKWPPIKYDKEFQNKVDKAKAEKEKIKEKVAISIFLKGGVTDVKAQSLIEEIKAINGVREVKFISKEEALEMYKERNRDEPLLLEFITEDILPTTIEVYLDDFSVINEVTQLAESRTIVESVVKEVSN